MKWILSLLSVLPLMALASNGATTYKPTYPPYHKPPLYSKGGAFPYRGAPFYFNRFKGAYMGAGGGVVLNEAQSSILVTPVQQINFTLNYRDSPREKSTSILGTLFFGYGFQVRRFYFGYEAGFDIAKRVFKLKREVRGNAQIIAYSSKLELALNEFYVDILPGFAFETSTLVYFRLGLTLGDVRLLGRVEQLSTATGQQALVDRNAFNQVDDVPGGMRFGFGVEQYLRKYFSVRFDWIYSNYGGIGKGNYVKSKFLPGNQEAISQTTRYGTITTQTFLLSVLYRFNL